MAERQLNDRWVAEAPQTGLDRQALFDRQERWRLEPEAMAGAELLEVVPSGDSPRGGLELRSEGSDPRLVVDVGLEASTVHELELDVHSPPGEVRIYWASAGEAFAESRRSSATVTGLESRAVTTLRFPVGTGREWSGSIDRLRIDLVAAPERTTELLSLRGIGLTADPEAITAALQSPWRFDFEESVRSGFVAPPGVPRTWSTAVRSGDELVLSLALESGVQSPVTFEVRSRQEGNSQLLLSRTLSPQRGESGRWIDERIALDDSSVPVPGAVELVFETTSESPVDLARGVPVFAGVRTTSKDVDPASPPNVVWVTIDTLRADRLSLYGHDRVTSPHLDRWARDRGVVFDTVVAAAPWTLPSTLSMFTGLEAIHHGINHNSAVPTRFQTLAETLRESGYFTVGITGGGYLRPQYRFDQGFDRFDYWARILAEEELASGREKLFDWLDYERASPFFLFFHTYEVHGPHRKRAPHFGELLEGEDPPRSRGRIEMRARSGLENLMWRHDHFVVQARGEDQPIEPLTDSEVELVGLMYDSAIRYVDSVLGELFTRLEELGLAENTIVVVTSDHGEALGEGNDRAGHNYLEDYNLLVPLVMSFPDGSGRSRRVDQQVRSIDIVPTLTDYLGLEAPQTDGVSLLGLIRGEAADQFPQVAWSYASSANIGVSLRYRNRLKFRWNNAAWSSLADLESLYDLRSDPFETRDLAGEHPAAQSLRSQVETYADLHRGLELAIRNEGPETLHASLLGDWAAVARVKSGSGDCRCWQWSSGRGEVRLESGERSRLQFEEVPGDRLVLSLRVGDRPAVRHVLSQREVAEEPWALAWTGGRFAPVDSGTSPEVPATGVRVWSSDVGGSDETSVPADPALREQLRALGYLN